MLFPGARGEMTMDSAATVVDHLGGSTSATDFGASHNENAVLAKVLSASSAHGTLPRGSMVSRYVLLGLVGSGGFGEVYSAYDPQLDRRVALKLMHASIKKRDGSRDQLQSEAKALARLNHENVLRVYDFGDHEDDVFLTMEFIDGQTLKDWFGATNRSWMEVRDVMVAAGRGLAAAHHAHIVHADFKPHNILIDRRNRVLVADFGLARAMYGHERALEDPAFGLDDAQRLQAASANADPRPRYAGSPAYMAPEQFRGQLDERSDQYSFCVTLFEGLFGRRPFLQTTLAELRIAVMAGEIVWPEPGHGVPSWICDVLVRGLALRPQERFASMDELLAALVSEPVAPSHRRRNIFLVGSATVALSLAVGVVWREEPDPNLDVVIARLADEARGAAAKHCYVHPPVDEPQATTAFTKVLALEGLDGDYDPAADERGLTLRQEFAATLTRIGDYYWNADYGKPFARDYYAQALVFDPTLEIPRARSEILPGEMAELRSKAATRNFTHGELVAAESLAALAKPNAKERADALAKLRKRANERSATMTERLDLMERASIVIAGADETRRHASGVDQVVSVFSAPLPSPQEIERSAPRDGASYASANDDPHRASGRPSESKRGDTKAVIENGSPTGATTNRSGASETVRRELAEARESLAKGRFEAAISAYHRVLKIDRHNGRALGGLSDAYFERGDYAKAVEFGERAVANSPKSTSFHITLGDAYQRVLRYDDALEHYRLAAALGSDKANRRLSALRKRLGQ
jgi:tetratricopeptide (TPR) repeat protein/predicted Ser/Thr protein kinase